MKVALVLSGGGARGLAHLGVLKALEKEQIQVDLIVGCSFGAIIGGMYAQSADARAVEERLHEYVESPEFAGLGLDFVRKRAEPTEDYLGQLVKNVKDWVVLNLIAKRISILKSDRLENTINFLLPDGRISETRIPFACNSTDLISGAPFLFREGSIRTAVRASASIPGYFPPVDYRGMKLVDGAVTHNLPVHFAREMGAQIVIAVDVHPYLQPEREFRNVLDIILRAKTITSDTLSEETLYKADVLISPPVKEYFWYEFDRATEIIQAGEGATNLMLDQIRALTRRGKPRRLRRKFSLRS